MQYSGRNGGPRAMRGRFDGFAYGVYVCFLLMPVGSSFVEAG